MKDYQKEPYIVTGDTGLNRSLSAGENYSLKNSGNPPPNKPTVPVQPDENPDPTRPRPGGNEPAKIDPTRIEEPSKTDPTRIDEPSPDKPEHSK